MMDRTCAQGRVSILVGDCRERMEGMEADSLDACVTDPPYGLTQGKKGGTGNGQGGFMGQKWDSSVPPAEVWAEVWRVLKPGAHLLAFSGTRTYHRVVCAIEDAGFEIRDQIGWAYGSGFPKSHNLKGEWQGWGTALKPAWEPICVARKPPSEKSIAANVLKHGAGAVNIDGCRVESGSRAIGPATQGRWPANLIHDGSDEVMECFPDAPGQQRRVGPEHGAKTAVNCFGDYGARDHFEPRGDSGSAARFFYCAKASRAERGAANNHPTVKPLALMRYLVRLVTPPGGMVLDPFGGSGTTGLAAAGEGFRAVLIEQDKGFARLAHDRIAAEWRERPAAEAAPDLGPLFAEGAT